MTNPLKHLLSRCRDQNRLAPNAIELFDSALFFDDSKDVVCPRRIGGQSQEIHQRSPRFLTPILQQDRPPGAPIGMKFLRNCQPLHRCQTTLRIRKGCPHEDTPFYAKVYRPTSLCSASGYRSHWTSMPEKALSISLRSSAESSTSVAPRLSSRR